MAEVDPAHQLPGVLQHPTPLDQAAYPHLVDRIIQLSPFSALFTFRLVSKRCCEVADQLLVRVLFVERIYKEGALHVFRGVKHSCKLSSPNFCFPENGSLFEETHFYTQDTTMVRLFGGTPDWFTPQGVLNDFDEIRCRGSTSMPGRWTIWTVLPFPQLNNECLEKLYPALYNPFWTLDTAPHTTLVPDGNGRVPRQLPFESSQLHLQLPFHRSGISVRDFYLMPALSLWLKGEDVTINIRLDANQTCTSYDYDIIALQRLMQMSSPGCIHYSNNVQRLRVIWDIVGAPEFRNGVHMVPYRLFELVAHSVFRHIQPQIAWTVVGVDSFLFDNGNKCTIQTFKTLVEAYSQNVLRLNGSGHQLGSFNAPLQLHGPALFEAFD